MSENIQVVVKGGTTNRGSYIPSKEDALYKELFDDNLITDEFFEDSFNWGKENCTIEDKLIIESSDFNPSYAYKRCHVLANHTYLVASYIKVDDITVTSYAYDGMTHSLRTFTQANGIGLKIRESLPSGPHYTVDEPYVAMQHKCGYVPILHTFKVFSDTAVNISIGDMYNHQGGTSGEVLHIGLYDITHTFITKPKYKDLYFGYKAYIEPRLKLLTNSDKVVYPDSIAKKVFVDEMNKFSLYLGTNNSKWFNASGVHMFIENRHCYINTPQPVYEKGYRYTKSGTKSTNTNFCSYIYNDINPKLTYQISGWGGIQISSGTFVTFWQGNTFIGYDSFTNISSGPKFIKIPHLLTIPSNCNKIVVGGDVRYKDNPDYGQPVLTYTSDIRLNENSIEITDNMVGGVVDYATFRPQSNRTTAFDMCLIATGIYTNENFNKLALGERNVLIGGNDRTTISVSIPHNALIGTGESPYPWECYGGKGGETHAIDSASHFFVGRDTKTGKLYAAAWMKQGDYNNAKYDVLQAIRYEIPSPIIDAEYAAGGWIHTGVPYRIKYSSSWYDSGIKVKKNENTMWHPSSCTKLLTAYVALEYSHDSDIVEVYPTDKTYGSGRSWQGGETMSIYDAIIEFLDRSDNTMATSVGRTIGYKILECKDN